MKPREKVRLSEIVAAVANAIGHDFGAPEAAPAREATTRAGWKWAWTSWEDLLEMIGEEKYPAPGLSHVVDDYTD